MSGIVGVEEQRAKWREASRRYRKRHPDRVREQQRAADARRWANGTKWSQKHPDEQRSYESEWLSLNPDKARAKYRRYYLTHKDQVREKDRRSREANPARVIANLARRRALRAAAEGDFTADEFRVLCSEYGDRCAYCQEESPLTADHAVPLSRGGSNWISNILPACKSCNSRKRTRTPEEFLYELVEGLCPA